MHTRHFTALVAAAATLAVVAGCAALPSAPSPDNSTSGPAPAGPTASAAPQIPLDADIALYIGATVTDAAGGVFDLTLRVHTSTTWDDTADSAALRPEFLSSACASGLSNEVYSAENWGFSLIDFSAVPAAGSTWAPGTLLTVLPEAGSDPLASGGIVTSAMPSTTGDLCTQSKAIGGSGDGTVVLGLADDADLSSWADHRYGFRAPTGLTLSNCTYLVTAAGTATDGGGDWGSVATDAECSVQLVR